MSAEEKRRTTCIHCTVTLHIGESCEHTRRADASNIWCFECAKPFTSTTYSHTNHTATCVIRCVRCSAQLDTAQPKGCDHATRFHNKITCHNCGQDFSPAIAYTYTKRKRGDHARHGCGLPIAHGTRNAALLPVPCFRHVLCVTGRCRCSRAPSPAGLPSGKSIYCVRTLSSVQPTSSPNPVLGPRQTHQTRSALQSWTRQWHRTAHAHGDTSVQLM